MTSLKCTDVHDAVCVVGGGGLIRIYEGSKRCIGSVRDSVRCHLENMEPQSVGIRLS